MMITLKYNDKNSDILFSDENEFNNSKLEQIHIQEDSCWGISDPEQNTVDPTYDPEFLERLHIITVFVVGLCGSLLVLLLLLCACLNNETVAELLCKKKSHLPNKGIDGYFPFGTDVASSSSTPTSDQEGNKKNLLSTDIPILIEPCDAPILGCDAVSIPLNPMTSPPSITSDDAISCGSGLVTDDGTSESPGNKSKKVEFLDDKIEEIA